MTYPSEGDNFEKSELIPHDAPKIMLRGQSRKTLREGVASYQVVGGVKAYQAYDG